MSDCPGLDNWRITALVDAQADGDDALVVTARATVTVASASVDEDVPAEALPSPHRRGGPAVDGESPVCAVAEADETLAVAVPMLEEAGGDGAACHGVVPPVAMGEDVEAGREVAGEEPLAIDSPAATEIYADADCALVDGALGAGTTSTATVLATLAVPSCG